MHLRVLATDSGEPPDNPDAEQCKESHQEIDGIRERVLRVLADETVGLPAALAIMASASALLISSAPRPLHADLVMSASSAMQLRVDSPVLGQLPQRPS